MKIWLRSLFNPGRNLLKVDLKESTDRAPEENENLGSFQLVNPPKTPYLVQANGKLTPNSKSRYYARVRLDIQTSSPVQGLLWESRQFVQDLAKAERREINRKLWTELFLDKPSTHVVHLGYTTDDGTRNSDLLYVRVRLKSVESYSADDIAIDLGEFLIRFLIGQAKDSSFSGMASLDPPSEGIQVFWLTMLFIRYRAVTLGANWGDR